MDLEEEAREGRDAPEVSEVEEVLESEEPSGRVRRMWRKLPFTRKPQVGEEPDPRFSLANERTFLAWIRTSLGLVVAGVAVIQFLRPFAIPGSRKLIGLVLVGMGAFMAINAYRRWEDADQALRRGQPLPLSVMPRILAYGVAIIAVLAGVLAVVAEFISPCPTWLCR